MIVAFNQAHAVEELLPKYNYKPSGKRWISPTSTSGLAGVTILDGRVFSHHTSDPLADGHAHDAFDIYRIIEHGSDTRSAVSAADEILRAVRSAGQDGMTRTQIRDLFKRHGSADRIGAALDLLARRNLVRRRTQETGGRPTEIWACV